jgi:hypothetical protein
MVVLSGSLFAASFLLAQDASKAGAGATPTTATSTASGPTSQASQPAEGEIAGSVVTERVGSAVANASVKLLNAKRQVITMAGSDDKGKFVLQHVPVGQGYTIRVLAPIPPAAAEGSKKDVSVEANKVTQVGAIEVYALPG